MRPVILDVFQGHIVLYCKGHYGYTHASFFEGLRRIWAIRCGLPVDTIDKSMDIYIANDMYKIILDSCMEFGRPNIVHLQDQLHRELGGWRLSKPENMTAIEAIIWEYRSILQNMQIRCKPEGAKRYKTMVKLPRPQKRIFKRILSGEGEYQDYDRLQKAA